MKKRTTVHSLVFRFVISAFQVNRKIGPHYVKALALFCLSIFVLYYDCSGLSRIWLISFPPHAHSVFFLQSRLLDGVKCQALEMSALAQALQNSCDGRTCFCVGGLFCQAKLFWSFFLFSFFCLTSKSCSCITNCYLVMGQTTK